MIVPMKKICLVAQKKDTEASLKVLQDEGTIHIQHVRPPTGDKVTAVEKNIKIFERLLSVLNPAKVQEPLSHEASQIQAKTATDLIRQIEDVSERITKRQVLLTEWEPWGNFEPKDFTFLSEQGVSAGLIEVSAKERMKISEDIIVHEIRATGPLTRCLVLWRGEKELPFKIKPLPPKSLGQMLSEHEDDKKHLDELQKELNGQGAYYDAFASAKKAIAQELAFESALHGLGESESLNYLQGYCPVDRMERLSELSRRHGWALLAEDPGSEDIVPTLLRNAKWIELIKPVFSFMNILPGYKEADVSWTFLLFFSVFFGILVGDVGYGVLFLLLTAFFHKKLASKVPQKTPFILMYMLSICAIVWGILSGSCFGQAWLSGKVQPLVPWLNDNRNVMKLCFVIAVIHLSIAHVWRVILRLPSLKALAEIGWLLVVWATFFLANLLILKEPLPVFGGPLFFTGLALIVLFSHPQRNIFKGLLAGIGELLANVLTFINNFADIVSYIRLFAVGLATVAVADAFNQIAGSIGMNSVLTGLATALILVFGHLLNLTLCALAVVVHGIRLNVLEFSTHMSLEWSGVSYDPLRKAG